MKQILIILLLLISLTSSGTNYYVSTSGNDANDGLSTGAPFKTLVKGRTLAVSPGDTLFLKRGDVWKSEVMTIQASGTALAPIVFTAYGTGAKPIITERDTISGWSKDSNWTDLTGNIWRFTGDYWIRTLWWDSTQVRMQNSSAVNADYPYFWDNSNLYLYLYSPAGNPGTLDKPLEMPFTLSRSTYYPIRGASKDYIHLINLDIRGGTTSVKIYDCDNWVIDSCIVGTDAPYYAIDADKSDNVIIRNCIIDSGIRTKPEFSYSRNEVEDGINIGKGCRDWEIHNCYIANWRHAGIIMDSFNEVLITKNIKIHDNYFTSKEIVCGRGLIMNCLRTTTGVEIYNNIYADDNEPEQIEASNVKFHHNIILRNNGHVGRVNKWGALSFNTYGTDPPSNEIYDNEIYNNIIADCYSYGLEFLPYVDRQIQGNKIYNNIFYNNDTIAGVQISIADHAFVLDNEFKNNLIYKQFHTDSLIYFGKDEANDYYKTVAEFNAKTGTAGFVIANNIGGDPLFVNATSDTLIIGAGSPAINAGIDVGLTTDFLGNMISSPPDIGAIEYMAPVPPSVGTVFMKYGGKLVKYNGKFMKY